MENKNKKAKFILIGIIVILIILVIVTIINRKGDNLHKQITNELINKSLIDSNTSLVYLSDLNTKDYKKCVSASNIMVNSNNFTDYIQCDDDINKDFIFLNINEKYNNLDTSKQGIIIKNNITYIVTNKDKTKNIDGSNSKLYPSITLNGSDLNIHINEDYIDPGVRAFDYKNNIDITSKVIKTDNIDNTKVGEYYINYYVEMNGYFNNITRKVNVIKNNTNLNVNVNYDTKISKDVNIKITITGDGYKSTTLPNGNTSYNYDIQYTVNKNDTYKFIINDVNNESIEKEIVITNIDDIKPTGTCNATITNKSVTFTVSANDNGTIKNYEYIVDNNNKISSTNNYIYKGTFLVGSSHSVKVKVVDTADNYETINCNLNNKLVRTQIKDKNDNYCLEGITCYKQRDYRDVAYGSGTISHDGCLPTSLTIAASMFNKKASNGLEYTPKTFIDEVFQGVVYKGDEEKIDAFASKLNLKVSNKLKIRDNLEELKNNLRKGDPVLILGTGNGCYTSGGHYLLIIGINEKDEVFVSDPYQYNYSSIKGGCTVNNWTSINEIINKGDVYNFRTISE